MPDQRLTTAREQYHADRSGKTEQGREARDELCRIAFERHARNHR